MSRDRNNHGNDGSTCTPASACGGSAALTVHQERWNDLVEAAKPLFFFFNSFSICAVVATGVFD